MSTQFKKELESEKPPEHDKLLLECLTEDGTRNILGDFYNIDGKQRIGRPTQVSVWICNCRAASECTRTVDLAWGNSSGQYCQSGSDIAVIYAKKCEYWPTLHTYETDYFGSKRTKAEDVPAPGKSIQAPLIVEKAEVLITNYLTEEPILSRNFKGFADILFFVTLKASYKLQLTDEWFWNDYTTIDEEFLLCVEVKPKLKSFTTCLRQIKQYMYVLSEKYNNKHVLGVIATYSKLEEEIIAVFKREKVGVAVFPNKKVNLLQYMKRNGGNR